MAIQFGLISRLMDDARQREFRTPQWGRAPPFRPTFPIYYKHCFARPIFIFQIG
jgi:hypothetical protein